MPPIVVIVAGIVLLVAGRSLFWLFVAITGFFVGAEVAGELFAGEPEWVVWVIAAGAGIVGAVLAMLFERVAFALAGFYAGGYLALVAVQSLDGGMPELAVFVMGGVLGAVLATLVLDWAIIILSSLVGAGLIVGALTLEPAQAVLLAGVLVAGGVLIQAGLMRGRIGQPIKRGD